jgi:alpha-tubulin suppressor-like RCC1 family protein
VIAADDGDMGRFQGWRFRVPVTRWGRRRRHRTPIVVAFLAVAALVLTGCNDYFAAGWGNNPTGALGTGTYESESEPTPVDTSGVLRDAVVVQAEAGSSSSCALAADGTASCWGRIPAGAPPGFDLTVPQPIPMNGVLTGKSISQVTASGLGQCALTSEGTLACWVSPTQVVEHKTGVLAGKQVALVDGGRDLGCAVTVDGIVACWWVSPGGVIDPVQVNTAGVLAGAQIVDLSHGGNSACALTGDGVVACWGTNESGQLGNGTTAPSGIPVPIDTSGVLAGKTIVGVDIGNSGHACAVTAEGSAACWGNNFFGQLGDGTTTNSRVPVSVASVGALTGSPITDIAAGGLHTCALLNDSSAACWGNNAYGQLGDGTQVNSVVPVAVAPLPAASGDPRPLVELSSGDFHNMAVYQEQQPSHLVSIASQRVLDTRLVGTGAAVTDEIGFDLQSVVPPGATAVTYNLVATGQTASGVAAIVPFDSTTTAQESSVINWSGPQQTIANGHVVRLGAERQLKVTMASTGSSHFVVDITGYFMPAGEPDGALYLAANNRLYDSRDGDGSLGPGESRDVAIEALGTSSSSGAQGASSEPELGDVTALNAVAPTAAAVNVTVTGTTGSGVITLASQPSSATSTVNWTGAGQTVANAVITNVSEAGTVTLTNNGTTPAEVVVDLTGFFVPAVAGVGASFYPTDPARTLDSRIAGGVLAAGETRVTTHPVPRDAVAMALNTTVTGTTGTGFVSVTPQGSGDPTTSTVNWYGSPMTRANGSIVPVIRTGSQTYAGGQFTTYFLHDTAGFFR